MKKKANRALSLLLSVVMCISLLPASAFAAVQSGATIYVKMTAPPTEGDQVIITNTEGTQALNYTTGRGGGISTAAVTKDSATGVITAPGSAKVWTVSGSGSSMKFQNGNYYLRHQSYSLGVSKNNTNNTWTVTSDQMYYTNVVVPWYLSYSGSSFTLSTSNSSTIAFYKAYTVAADPVKASNLTYDGTAQVLVEGGTGYTLTSTGEKVASIATDDAGSVKKGDAFAENAGSYQITATLKAGYAWSDGTTAAKVIDVTIDKGAVTAPTAVTGLTYNGQAQTIVAGNDLYTLSCSDANATLDNDSIKAVNAGEYTVTAALNDEANYEWATAFGGSVTATIAKADASITPVAKEVMKGAFTDTDLPTAAVNGVCSGESIDYVIVVTDKDGKVINTLGADSKTYEPVTADQLNALVVGEYTLSIQLLADDASAAVQANYNLTTNGPATLTVQPKTSDVKVADGENFVENTSGNGLTITGTTVGGDTKTNEDASGTNLTVEVLSQGDPITATSENGLNLADNESVLAKFEVNLYLGGEKMNTGATLNKKIQVQVPVDAKDGMYEVAHWDGTQYTRLTEKGIVENGILTFATNTFSPFVIIGTTTYVKMIGTPADEEGYTITYDNTYNTVIVDSDGNALSEKDEDYVFTVTAKPGYKIVSVTDNGTEMTPVGSTYTIPAAAADTNHKIVVTARPADVTVSYAGLTGATPDAITPDIVTYGKFVNLPGAPTKNGYTFAGWLSTKENKTYGAGDPFTPTVDDTLTAVWVADITVSYNVDGSTITSATVAAGASVLLPAAPTHTDKVFTGWKSANTGAIFAAETLYTPAANDTLTAQWVDKYVITVKSDGATVDTMKVAPGANATVPDAPTKSGYVFVGWYSTANAQTYAPGYLYTPAGDDTLTARWAQLYAVIYDTNGGKGTAPSESDKVAGAEFIVKGAELTRDGYTFVGWKSSATGVTYQPGAFYTMTAVDTTFTAQWEKVATYTVTYAPNGGTGTDVVDTAEYYELDTVSVKDNTWTAPAGKVFAGWKSSVDGTIYNEGDSFNMPGMNVILTAQWADVAATYTVTYNEGTGTGTVPTETDKAAGAVFAVKAPDLADLTNPGYTFVGWKSSADNAIYAPGASYTMTAVNTTFTAQWEANPATYTVTYNAGTGTGTVPTETAQVAGAVITLKAPTLTNPGFTFVGWLSDADHAIYQPGDNYTMTAADTEFTAQWEANPTAYTVTYNANGGSGTVPTETDKVAGAEFAVKASELTNSGYIFAGWKSDQDGAIYQPGDTYTMTAANTTFTAQWKEVDKYTVAYNVDGTTTIDGTTYAENAVYTVSGAPTKTGYIFTGWRNSVDDVIYADGATFLMPAQNVTLIATWVEEDAIFHVTYDMNGADSAQITDTKDYNYAAIVKVDATAPAKTGYTFAGWLRSDNGEIVNAGDNINMPACNLTLTAQWNAVVKYTVNYELDGGTASIDHGEYLGLAQAAVTTTKPIKDGYRFMGWLDKTTGIEYASGETFTMPEKNITLTAQWAKEYTVKFDLGAGAGQNGNPTTIASQTVILGDKLTSVGAIKDWNDGKNPSKDYYFCGWKNQNGTYWSFEYDVVDDGCFVGGVMTLTAQWDTVKRYNIVFDDNLADPLDDYVTIDGAVVATGTKQIDNIAANTKLTDSQYPDFARVDYILGVDNTKSCDWYLDANYTFAYDATDTLAGNDADRYAKPDGTLVLYAKWTAKYDARGDVKMDAASLAETGTYNTYYSDWVEAWEVADIIQPDRVYRNFYVINGTLPDGLKLNKRTGEIYGVPNKVGTYTFTLAMTNDEGRFISETQDFTITIKAMQLKVDRDGTIYNKIYGNADPAELLKALNIVVKVDGSDVLANSDTYNFGGTTTEVTFSNVVADQQFSLAYDYTGANNANTTNHGLFTGAATKAQLLNNLKYADAYATMASTTDVFTAGTVRQDGEDAGTYKISLANDALTAANKAQYAITIEEEFNNPNKAVAPATDTAKYIFTIDKATLTIGNTGYNPAKIYGENDPDYADITFSTLTVPNASDVTKATDSNKVTIVFTGTDKAGFTDVVNIDLQRVPGEDKGNYQLYLAAENVTGTSTTKTAPDAADPINNYNIVIEASMTKDDPANTNKLSINTHAVTFTPDAATITYGDLKVAEDVAVAGSLATKDTATYGLADNAGIGVKDTMTVKVNNVNDYKSKAGYLKAGTYADTDTPEAILFAMTNGANPMGTADADTLDNYVIGYSFIVGAKELTVAGQDVNVTKGSAPTAANIAALAKLNDGVLTGDDVTLTVASYTYGGTTYVNTDAGVADLIAAIGTIDADKTVTVNCTLTGADAANYTLAAGSVDATLKAYTASSGGGGGGGGGVVTYAITVNSAENGSVTSSSKSAAAGATVTLTVKPDTGYTLETLTVTNAKGNEVSVTAKDGKYTFTMPASKVTVTATFMEDNTVLNFFVDVPVDAYYYEAVRWAVVNGITSGTSATTFSPDASCTRAQIVTFLWRAAGSPAPESDEMPFVDVPADAYYYDAVLWAVENGITSGTSATTFSPNATCTRAQSVTFLWRAQGSPAVEAESIFTDVADDVYYAEAVLWAVEEGITNGTSSTTFSPNDDCTRAQIVTFIWRALAE